MQSLFLDDVSRVVLFLFFTFDNSKFQLIAISAFSCFDIFKFVQLFRWIQFWKKSEKNLFLLSEQRLPITMTTKLQLTLTYQCFSLSLFYPPPHSGQFSKKSGKIKIWYLNFALSSFVLKQYFFRIRPSKIWTELKCDSPASGWPHLW